MSHEHPHLNVYHLEESLSFQFILSELISAFHQLESIHEIRKVLEKKRIDPSVYQHLLNELVVKIRELAGATPDYNRLYSWDVEYGILTKLKHYWTYFCVKLDKEASEGHLFEHYGSKSWILCMEILDVVRQIQLSSARKAPKREVLIKLLKKLDQVMHRFAKQIVKLIEDFSDDEHVIFFLIRHQEELDRIYGVQFLSKHLTKMHPKGLRGISRMLINRYSKRGFHDLVPFIEEKLAQLA